VEVPPLPPVEKQDYHVQRPGSSKLRLWMCDCPVRVRVAVADFRARCLECGCLFRRCD
jgi:hypothetical protein